MQASAHFVAFSEPTPASAPHDRTCDYCLLRSQVAESGQSQNQEKSPTYCRTLFLVAQVHSNWSQLLVELPPWVQLSRGTAAVSYSATAG